MCTNCARNTGQNPPMNASLTPFQRPSSPKSTKWTATPKVWNPLRPSLDHSLDHFWIIVTRIDQALLLSPWPIERMLLGLTFTLFPLTPRCLLAVRSSSTFFSVRFNHTLARAYTPKRGYHSPPCHQLTCPRLVAARGLVLTGVSLSVLALAARDTWPWQAHTLRLANQPTNHEHRRRSKSACCSNARPAVDAGARARPALPTLPGLQRPPFHT